MWYIYSVEEYSIVFRLIVSLQGAQIAYDYKVSLKDIDREHADYKNLRSEVDLRSAKVRIPRARFSFRQFTWFSLETPCSVP